MKRYEPILDHSIPGVVMPDMRPADDGQWLSRADLIAAGVLVPVPDGEAVRYYDRHPNYFIFEGRLLRDNGIAQHPTTLNFDDFSEVSNDDRIEPVRLVRLEDVG